MAMRNVKFTDEIPDGFSLEHNKVHPDVWANIANWLSSDMLPSVSVNEQEAASISATDANGNNLIYVPIPWETGSQMQGRKVAQFGNCRYDYSTDAAKRCNPPNNCDIPDYIRQTLLKGEPNCQQFTQCIINMYESSNIIPWHLDHEHFGPEVLVYTFGEERPLLLRRPLDDKNMIDDHDNKEHAQSKDDEMYSYSQAHPRHCSKYLLSGQVRHVWEHSVPSGNGKRVSITFRSWVGPE